MKLLLLVALLGVAYVAAECPEACNGHGFCGEYDKCSCYRNWQGNSCADRTCPFDIAFVDIPHGDLNMDGKLTDDITTYGAQINDIYAFEVYPTDGYQINRDSGTDDDDNDSSDDDMYHSTSGNEKAATFYDMVEDGHFYAECSNKGMCDRKSGQCDCFDGYSGTACRRVACPNDCSGHGTCETIAETATDASHTYELWDRYKTQVCACDPGYFGIDCAQRHCPYGDDPLSTDQHNEIQWLTLKSIGSGINGPTNTANGVAGTASTYTTGDLDLSGTFRLAYLDEYGETWNTSPIGAHSYKTNTNTVNDATAKAIKDALEGIPNSVFEEVEVELWPIQTPIPGLWSCTSGTCTLTEDTTNQKVAKTDVTSFVPAAESYKWGISNCARAGPMTCDFQCNSAADNTGTACTINTDCPNGACEGTSGDGETEMPGYKRCEYGGAFITEATGTGGTTGTIAGTGTVSGATSICRYQMNGFRAKITFKTNPGNINELTCDADLVTTIEHSDSNAPATDIVCEAKDFNDFELGAVGEVHGSAIGGQPAGSNGQGRITTNMNLRTMLTHGDRVKTSVGVRTIAGPIQPPGTGANADIVIEEETTDDAGITDYNLPAAKWWGQGTTENDECSHRGLCNHDEGLCECFTGYTHDDCSMQDALNA